MPSYAITGAARGLGFEFVRQLSSVSGNVVFAIVRNKGTAQGLQDLARANIHILEADITDFVALKKASKDIGELTGGKLDVLINNAAFVDDKRFGISLDDYTDDQLVEDDLVHAFKINTVGVVHTINAFLPLLRGGSLKKVVTLSTGIADTDFTLGSEFSVGAPYSISKAAVNMAVVKYAVKYKSEGFTFLCISPGVVNTATKPPTPEELKFFGEMIASFKKVTPTFERPLTPEESVKLMLAVVEKSTVKDTGAFISQNGNKEWL
ncbi:NAD(P)-binding protein [Schizopora paradoxa]|uniref:NAD(P)-binding protein n=1 Tax=Schizopora paradoxa TaxID=27342 RepID=A0A0H2SSA3_9AGAM|nr:NAD(P)-binding protein [Schizopora paradoxa]